MTLNVTEIDEYLNKLSTYYKMFNPPSHRMKLSSVWGSVKLSLCVSPVIFRLQRAVEGRELPVILLQPQG